MREQRKAERVTILGIEMDSIRIDRAMNLTGQYLEMNKFEYIAFVNTPAALAGQNRESFVKLMEQAALVLPGDNNIEDAVGLRHWIEEETSYQNEFFRRLFNRLNRQRASVFFMVGKEDQLECLIQTFKKRYDKIQLEYCLWQDDENVDGLVNEINILAPDILLICGDYDRICTFMSEHASKVNAGLCFTMESAIWNEGIEIPDWIRRFHLQNIYRWLYLKPRDFWYDTIFRRRMKENTAEQQDETEKFEKSDEKI